MRWAIIKENIIPKLIDVKSKQKKKTVSSVYIVVIVNCALGLIRGILKRGITN